MDKLYFPIANFLEKVVIYNEWLRTMSIVPKLPTCLSTSILFYNHVISRFLPKMFGEHNSYLI